MAETVFARPEALADVSTHYCPGCTHGVIHRLVAEVIDALGAEKLARIDPTEIRFRSGLVIHPDPAQILETWRENEDPLTEHEPRGPNSRVYEDLEQSYVLLARTYRHLDQPATSREVLLQRDEGGGFGTHGGGMSVSE